MLTRMTRTICATEGGLLQHVVWVLWKHVLYMLWFSEIAVSSHNSMSSSIFAPAEALSKLGWRQVLHLPAISKLVHHLTSCILQKACKEQRNCHFQFTTVLTCGSIHAKNRLPWYHNPTNSSTAFRKSLKLSLPAQSWSSRSYLSCAHQSFEWPKPLTVLLSQHHGHKL